MNGRSRLLHAADRKCWKVSGRDFPGKMLNVQEFVNDDLELLIEVAYSGYTVKAARLWDFSDGIVSNAPDGVPSQALTAADRDKAGRIECVLLGNGRRF